MHDTNRGGLVRHSDNAGSKVVVDIPAISGLIGSVSTFLDVMETFCVQRMRGDLR